MKLKKLFVRHSKDSDQVPEQLLLPSEGENMGGTVDFIVPDISISMEEEGFEPGVRKIDLAYESLKGFLKTKRRERPDDYVAVLPYSSKGYEVCRPLRVKNHYEELCGALKIMRDLPRGGTQLWTGLTLVLDIIVEDHLDHTSQRRDRGGLPGVRVIAYSDGHDQEGRKALEFASLIKERGVVIETLGVARRRQDCDEALLKAAASPRGQGKGASDTTPRYRFLGDGDALRTTLAHLGTGTLVI